MKVRIPSDFELYMSRLREENGFDLSSFFADFHRHCDLDKRELSLLREDFENAFLYYDSIGLPLEEAKGRLEIKNIGSFYARPPVLWYTLDDAAKVYPLALKHGRMSVFRLSAYLKKPVIPQLLQIALAFVMKRFPSFATTVKKGFFWHYLDTTKRRYAIEVEEDMPCRPLPVARSGSQSFRVLYHENRISVEYFHMLTDGTGGITFLKALLVEYLRLCGVSYDGDDLFDINGIPTKEEVANEFSRARDVDGSGGFLDKPAIQMGGRLSATNPCQVLHFKMDVSKLSRVVKSHNTTVTAYLLSKMFLAGKAATDELSGMMNIQVPVNMRKFYPSKTLRNFSMFCGIKLPIEEIHDDRVLLEKISQQLSEKASKTVMAEMMNSTCKMVNALRYIPLALKTPVAKVVYGFLGDKVFSNTLTNLGIVTLPEEFAAHIESMDFILGSALINRASCGLVTFGDIATLCITKLTADPSFEETLYKLLTDAGVPVIVEGSPLYGN